jgi:hypothetical protein
MKKCERVRHDRETFLTCCAEEIALRTMANSPLMDLSTGVGEDDGKLSREEFRQEVYEKRAFCFIAYPTALTLA